MKEYIIFNITLVLFSISFAWMVNERANKFPLMRRFRLVFYPIFWLIYPKENSPEFFKRSESGFIVLMLSWPTVIVFLFFSIKTLEMYYYASNNAGIIIRYILPFAFFMAPLFVSRLISSLVLWLAKDEIRFLWENDNDVFDIFSSSWKENNHLNEEGIKSGKVHKKGCVRSIESIIVLAITCLSIYLYLKFMG